LVPTGWEKAGGSKSDQTTEQTGGRIHGKENGERNIKELRSALGKKKKMKGNSTGLPGGEVQNVGRWRGKGDASKN